MASTPALLERLTTLLEPVVLDHGLELAELQFRREGHGWILRLVIDGEEGVTLDDCARISREAGHLLEVEDPIEQAYHLEVSSPGLDRPLKNERDFRRARGKKAKIVTTAPVAGKNAFIGQVGETAADRVAITTEDGKVEIPLALVSRARLVVEF